MRILVIGSGGREHAIVWKLCQSSAVTDVLVTPGNGGTHQKKVRTFAIAAHDIPALVALAVEEKVDLVVPGPELPLTLGIADALAKENIACFGPDEYCAQLEGSKAFAKDIMLEAKVPTAHSERFNDYDAACKYVQEKGAPIVIKADGLAAGKGVVVAQTLDEAYAALREIMCDKVHGEAGNLVVIEDHLVGEEASFLCFCDGEHAVALPSAQDHKPIFNGDTGPNTGGMGAYSPAPVLPDSAVKSTLELVILPILRVLAAKGHPYKGVLYAGLMITAVGPKVIEYNVRFGDPECQPLLMRLLTPLDTILKACVDGTLHEISFTYTPEAALGVVLAAEGYPGKYDKGMLIEGIDVANALPGVRVFHSGTIEKDGKIYAQGGRVLCVTALGADLKAAQHNAYVALGKIKMPQGQYRSDIGSKGIERLKNIQK